ncbi:MAG: class I SAM-dependent methyltransferase [Chloroflexi bacterium]|nr:class I SAM-dependent methyltransferase [Chloroflexota bacterium]
MAAGIFDEQAARYDAWYDTTRGAVVLAEELDAVRPLLAEVPRPWLEVGVGTGRFAAALGVEVGLDPARAALALAVRRGVSGVAARGEALPFPDGTFGAVLFVLTLCFVDDPLAALREARRVLRLDGGVVLGVVPAEGPWGRHYQALAARGHPYYRNARFFTRPELASLMAVAGFTATRTRSALCWVPEAEPASGAASEGDDPQAGFTAVLGVATRLACSCPTDNRRSRRSPVDSAEGARPPVGRAGRRPRRGGVRHPAESRWTSPASTNWD